MCTDRNGAQITGSSPVMTIGVMAGLDPAISVPEVNHVSNGVQITGSSPTGRDLAGEISRQPVVEILPHRILLQDQGDFPGARPVLQVLLSLNGISDILVPLYPNEPFKAVFPGEAIGNARAVLPSAARDIAGDADIQSPIWTVGDNVDPSTLHRAILPKRN